MEDPQKASARLVEGVVVSMEGCPEDVSLNVYDTHTSLKIGEWGAAYIWFDSVQECREFAIGVLRHCNNLGQEVA